MPRRLPFALFALFLVACLPAAAMGAVTSSSITTPAASPLLPPLLDGSLPTSDPARQFPIAGTTDGADGDLLDVRCFFRSADGSLGFIGVAENLPAAGGAFSGSGTTPTQAGCRLAAIPDGSTGGGLPAFAGPKVFSAVRQVRTVGGVGPNAAVVRTAYAGTTSRTMDADAASVGDGGAPFDMAPMDDTGAVPQFGEYLWYGNAALYSTTAKTGESRSQIRVDGVNAFAPASAAQLYDGVASAGGLPSVTVESTTFDPVTRDLTTTTTEPIVTCPTTGGVNIARNDATLANCGTLQPSGVAIQRTVAIRNATRSVETKDRWVSTDGSSHAIDLLYDETQQKASGATVGFRFPWVDGATAKTHAADDEIALPPGRVSTLFAKTQLSAPDGDTRWTQGSMTVAPRPDLIRFADDQTFELGFRRTVPATGALAIEQRFTIGTTLADIQTQAQTMEQRAAAGLAIAITSPTQVSGYDPSYTVSGSTSAVSGVRSVLVNGTAVTPAADGTWSLPMRLLPGANALTATLTDGAGDSVTTAGTVTFTPGATQATVLSAGVRRGVLSATLRCQTPAGSTCTGRVKLTARVTRVKRTSRGKRRSTKTVTLASRAYAIPSGDSAIKPVKLGRAGRALVRKYRIKRGTLTLTQTVGTFTKTTKTSVPVRL